MFDAYLERMYVTRTEHMMDMAQSAIYAQLTNEARRSLWNSWTNTVSTVTNRMVQQDNKNKSVLTWNGAIIGVKELMKKFTSTWGRSSVVSK